MKRRQFLSLALLSPALVRAQSPAPDLNLVLVAGGHSNAKSMTPAEVRKLYLGVPVTIEGKELLPLVNNTNLQVKEIFLQKVLFMSAQVYERQLLSKQFRNGARTIEHVDLQALLATLQNDPNAVSFMTPTTARANKNIKILGDLWTA